MPFTQDYIQIDQVHIHLLKYVDFDPYTYLDQLTANEKERFFGFTHQNRRKEFVATRILRHRLFGFTHIHYDVHGAPYIDQEGFISISHAKDIVGIALCKDFKVGFDLETIRSKASSVAHKFLNEVEQTQFDINDPLEMTKVWSAKEVLYKLAGRKGIHFKTELLLHKDQTNNWTGRIINPNEELVTRINVFDHLNTIVSVNIKACESK
jgi:4'-phosphopantetheinyl transferase